MKNLKNIDAVLFCTICIILIGCVISGKEESETTKQKKEININPVIEDLEKHIATVKAKQFEDIGTTSGEIMMHLKKVVRYEDLLKYIEGRGFKNNTIVKALDFGTFYIKENIWTKNGRCIGLSYLVQNDTIGYGVVHSIDSNYIHLSGKEEFVRDEAFLARYIGRHNEFYKTKKKGQDLIREVIELGHKVNIASGYADSYYGDKEVELFKAVARNNIKYVESLLRSISPEIQTLGIIGMIKLKENGVKLGEDTIKIINHLKERDSSISATITCVGGEFKLSRYLSAYDWSKMPNKKNN